MHRAPDSSHNRPQPCRPALGDWQLQAIGASNIRALEFGARRAALLRACCQAPLRHLAAASIKYIALQKALQKDCQLHSAAKALACLGTGVDPTTTCVHPCFWPYTLAPPWPMSMSGQNCASGCRGDVGHQMLDLGS